MMDNMMNKIAKDTYAFIVGIEQYDKGREWELNGAVNGAIQFAEYLLENQVPACNIRVHLKPSSDNEKLKSDFLHSHPEIGCGETLMHDIIQGLFSLEKQGKQLYIYWAGHGFYDNNEEDRVLFVSNSEEVRKVLSFGSVLSFLKDSEKVSFEQEVIFVDSCASEGVCSVEDLRYTVERLPKNLKIDRKTEQYAFYAAKRGYSTNYNNNIGDFSKALLSELNDLNKLIYGFRNLEKLKLTISKLHNRSFATLQTYSDAVPEDTLPGLINLLEVGVLSVGPKGAVFNTSKGSNETFSFDCYFEIETGDNSIDILNIDLSYYTDMSECNYFTVPSIYIEKGDIEIDYIKTVLLESKSHYSLHINKHFWTPIKVDDVKKCKQGFIQLTFECIQNEERYIYQEVYEFRRGSLHIKDNYVPTNRPGVVTNLDLHKFKQDGDISEKTFALLYNMTYRARFEFVNKKKYGKSVDETVISEISNIKKSFRKYSLMNHVKKK